MCDGCKHSKKKIEDFTDIPFDQELEMLHESAVYCWNCEEIYIPSLSENKCPCCGKEDKCKKTDGLYGKYKVVKPYVCKLWYNPESQKIERDYVKLRESNSYGSVNGLHETFQGDYTLDNHEVVEVYTGKTERNIMSFIKRKKLYFVCEEGSLLEVKGDRIKLWLMGEMIWKDLWL